MGSEGGSRMGEDGLKAMHGLLLIQECDSDLDGGQRALDGSSYNWGNTGFMQRTCLLLIFSK